MASAPTRWPLQVLLVSIHSSLPLSSTYALKIPSFLDVGWSCDWSCDWLCDWLCDWSHPVEMQTRGTSCDDDLLQDSSSRLCPTLASRRRGPYLWRHRATSLPSSSSMLPSFLLQASRSTLARTFFSSLPLASPRTRSSDSNCKLRERTWMPLRPYSLPITPFEDVPAGEQRTVNSAPLVSSSWSSSSSSFSRTSRCL
jgi:hypothetical protein